MPSPARVHKAAALRRGDGRPGPRPGPKNPAELGDQPGGRATPAKESCGPQMAPGSPPAPEGAEWLAATPRRGQTALPPAPGRGALGLVPCPHPATFRTGRAHGPRVGPRSPALLPSLPPGMPAALAPKAATAACEPRPRKTAGPPLLSFRQRPARSPGGWAQPSPRALSPGFLMPAWPPGGSSPAPAARPGTALPPSWGARSHRRARDPRQGTGRMRGAARAPGTLRTPDTRAIRAPPGGLGGQRGTGAGPPGWGGPPPGGQKGQPA